MSDPRHEELRELAASYALGALPPAERDAFERHAAVCPECAAEVEALGPVADLLAQAVPQQEPAPALRARVLAAATAQASAPSNIRADAQTFDFHDKRAPISPRMSPSTALPWLLAAASLVAAVGLGVYALQLRGKVDALGADLQAAARTTADLERQLVDVQRTAEGTRMIATVISSPDLARIDLAGQQTAPGAVARAFWSDSRDALLISASNLPPLAAGRAYQVWTIPPGASPISAGLLSPDAQGRAQAVLATQPGMAPPAVVAVSEEPAGGSSAPSTQPFLLGKAVAF